VSGVGDILMTPPSGSITSFASAAPIVTSATVLSLTGSVGVLAIGMDGAGGMSGGQVSVVGGSAAQSVILMLIVIALTVVQFRFVEKKVQY
jgi:hypothetical protein